MVEQLKDLCIKVSKESPLRACLEKYTKPRLRKLLEFYGESVPSSLKKQELVEKAEATVMDGAAGYAGMLSEEEAGLLASFCGSSILLTAMEEMERALPLYERGFIYLADTEGGAEIIVPQEIKAAVCERPRKEADMHRTSLEAEVIKYAKALANIYGVYPVSQLKEVWDFNHQRGISPADVRKALEKSGDYDGFYTSDSYDSYIVNNVLEDIEAYSNILECLDRMDVYYYPVAEVINEYENSIMPNPEPEYFYINSLLSRKIEDELRLEKVMSNLALMCVRNASLGEIFDYFFKNGVNFESQDEEKLFGRLFFSWFCDVRIWPYKGYKPSELKPEKLAGRGFMLSSAAMKIAKPGRNDTCPCGSGKKFKNCCLKYI